MANKVLPGVGGEDIKAKHIPGSGVGPAPEPGEEISPQSRNWNPGPDGDNCVTDQPPPDDIPC